MKKYLSLIFIMLLFLINLTNVFALTINEIELGTPSLDFGTGVNKIVIQKDGINYLMYGDYSSQDINVIYVSGSYCIGHMNTSGTNYYSYNPTLGTTTTGPSRNITFTTLDSLKTSIKAANFNVSYNGTTLFTANFSNPIRITHNDKIQVQNVASTMMKEDLTITLSQAAVGSILVTDIFGKFIEQTDINLTTGTTVKVKITAGETRNVYLQFASTSQDTIASIDNFAQPHFNIKKFEPKYEIIGQLFYEIDGTSDMTARPYIMPNSKSLILYKVQQSDGTYKTNQLFLEKDQKYSFEIGKKTIFQFQHEAGSSILVESNFKIQTSSDTIQVIDQKALDDLKNQVYGTGVPLLPATQDTIIFSQPSKAVKIESLLTDVQDGYLNYTIQPSTSSSGLVEWFQEIDNTIIKYKDLAFSGTGNVYHQQMQGNQYVVIKDNTGSTKITIPGKFIVNEDYIITYMPGYTTPTDIETEYRTRVPTIPNIQDSNDYFSQPYDENFYDWINGQQQTPGTDLSIADMTNISSQITSFTDMFVGPIKTLFTGVPEIYALIVFGFGIAIVKFVLGR